MFRPADLPGLDPDEQLVVARRLLREGVVIPRGPESDVASRAGSTRSADPAIGAVRGAGGAARRPDARHRVSGSRLLLVEQPGPWGRAGLLDSRFDRAVAHRLIGRLDRQRVRVVAIRRPGRLGRHRPRRWAVVGLPPGSRTVAVGAVRRRRRAAGGSISIGPAGRFDPATGRSGTDDDTAPLYAVCAHGTHDVCCAIRGRPVAAALDRVRPGQVWECSHVGGDRFAANVLVLPSGVLYGRVVASAAAALVEAADRGGVLDQHLRGRVGFAPDVQAAMALAHRERPGSAASPTFGSWRAADRAGPDLRWSGCGWPATWSRSGAGRAVVDRNG